MKKRKLEELNLLDDFLFGTMVSYPMIGEEFGRELVRIIIGKEVDRLLVVPQKVYYGSDTDMHGARLDVYLEEKGTVENGAVIYDVEPDKNDDKESVENLPKRVRFYHAKIDGKSLKAGETYRSLKKVYIIMIMPYDPLGRNRMVYTIKNGCQEEPDIPYEDGARTIFLYTKGKIGNATEELRQLLNYMEHSTEENAGTDTLKKIHQMVKTVKRDEEVSLEYMKIFEREEMLKNQGRREGRQGERQSAIMDLLNEMGSVSDELEKKIRDQRDIAILTKWFKIAAKASSMEEFENAITRDDDRQR